jgi:hypothetical protein
MASFELLASAAQTDSDVSAAVEDLREYNGGTFFLNVTAAATDAGDTLNVYVQRLLPDGTTWDDIVAFTQVLGNGGTVAYVADVIFDSQASDERVAQDAALTAGTVNAVPFADDLRVKWVIVDVAADDASFTFSVTADLF